MKNNNKELACFFWCNYSYLLFVSSRSQEFMISHSYLFGEAIWMKSRQGQKRSGMKKDKCFFPWDRDEGWENTLQCEEAREACFPKKFLAMLLFSLQRFTEGFVNAILANSYTFRG